MQKILLTFLSFYQKHISPGFVATSGRSCRFTPTCSEYSLQAIEKYGALKGLIMGIKRFLRCNPLSKGGYDPVQ